MNRAMLSLMKKDFKGITANRRLFSAILIVPLVLTVFLPSLFIVLIHFAPDDPDFQSLAGMLPQSLQGGSLEMTIAGLVLNYIMPLFFLMIPIMTASVMAASSFVGEKERRTLETLLYSPLSLKQIFRAKVAASFLLSMLVSFLSFFAMLVVVEAELFFLAGGLLLPGASWAAILLLVSPAISLIAVTLIVRRSAKAQSVEESQQGAVFLIVPVILLVTGQFSGVLLVSVWLLLGIGAVCGLLAWLLLKSAMGKFTYEMLVK